MNIKLSKKQRLGIILFFCIVILISSLMYFKNKNDIKENETSKNKVLVENIEKPNETPSKKSEIIKAYICGEVKSPGVYTLNSGDRLEDLVKKAGGFSENANPSSINLALQIKDQDYFNILNKNEENKVKDSVGVNTSASGVSTSSTNNINKNEEKININLASKEELIKLPRIGEALATRIIEYRESSGIFKDIEDIKEVSGIGDKLFEGIKEKITI